MTTIMPLQPDLGSHLFNGVASVSQLAQDFPSFSPEIPTQSQVKGAGFVLVPSIQFLTCPVEGARGTAQVRDGWTVCLLSKLGGNITRTPSDKGVLPPARVSQKTAPPRQVSGSRPLLEKRELGGPQACC